MRTSKRWTNVTFTRRVDHEAGKHRQPDAGPGRQVCSHCGAINLKRRWVSGEAASAQRLQAVAKAKAVVCPACRMAEDARYAGEVRVTGAFVPQHRPEIERLIRNEARRAAEDNPLARIVKLDRAREGLRITTTTEHLAKRIGQALHKALRGQVTYNFSHENKFAHVLWSREQ